MMDFLLKCNRTGAFLVSKNILTQSSRKFVRSGTKKCSFSTTIPSTPVVSMPSVHRIVSRRSVKKYLKENKNHPLNQTRQKAKADESPWPQSLQLLGYTIAGISVPFSIGAAIVEIPSFRRFVQGGYEDQISILEKPTLGGMIVNAIREFWGTEEAMPEEERRWLSKQSESHNKPSMKSFDNDDPIHVRNMQQEIGKLIHSPQRVKVTTYSLAASSEMEGVIPDGNMAWKNGRNKSVRKDVLNKLNINTDMSGDAEPPFVALDFLDEAKEDNKMEDTDALDDDGSMSIIEKTNDYADDLRAKTQSWSSWHLFPSATPSNNESASNKTPFSNDDIRKSELEWKLAELKQQLSDPTCLRDIDEMLSELKGYEKELKRLNRKWIRF